MTRPSPSLTASPARRETVYLNNSSASFPHKARVRPNFQETAPTLPLKPFGHTATQSIPPSPHRPPSALVLPTGPRQLPRVHLCTAFASSGPFGIRFDPQSEIDGAVVIDLDGLAQASEHKDHEKQHAEANCDVFDVSFHGSASSRQGGHQLWTIHKESRITCRACEDEFDSVRLKPCSQVVIRAISSDVCAENSELS